MPAAVDGLKQCSKCAETKPVSEYSKTKRNFDGFKYACKTCIKKEYQDNREYALKRQEKYYQANKERRLNYNKEYYEDNKERILEQCKEYYEDNKEYIRERRKTYHEENREKVLKRKREYQQKLPAAIYKIENKITGKIYIGQSVGYPARWGRHRFDMRHGKHDNSRVQHDYDEHGLESFEFSVIQEYPCDTDSDILFEHEQRLIDEYLAEGKELYNISRYS